MLPRARRDIRVIAVYFVAGGLILFLLLCYCFYLTQDSFHVDSRESWGLKIGAFLDGRYCFLCSLLWDCFGVLGILIGITSTVYCCLLTCKRRLSNSNPQCVIFKTKATDYTIRYDCKLNSLEIAIVVPTSRTRPYPHLVASMFIFAHHRFDASRFLNPMQHIPSLHISA